MPKRVTINIETGEVQEVDITGTELDGYILATRPEPKPSSAFQPVGVEDLRTTDATQTTLASWPLDLQTLYTARFTVMAMDVGNADCKVWTAKVTAKRVNAGALLVGTPTLETTHPDAGASGWVVSADTSGTNFRVRVTGVIGRTISWSLIGEVLRARPDGLVRQMLLPWLSLPASPPTIPDEGVSYYPSESGHNAGEYVTVGTGSGFEYRSLQDNGTVTYRQGPATR